MILVREQRLYVEPGTAELPIVWSSIESRGYLNIDALAKHEKTSPLLVAELRRVVQAAAAMTTADQRSVSVSVLRFGGQDVLSILDEHKKFIMVPFVVWRAAVIAVERPTVKTTPNKRTPSMPSVRCGAGLFAAMNPACAMTTTIHAVYTTPCVIVSDVKGGAGASITVFR